MEDRGDCLVEHSYCIRSSEVTDDSMKSDEPIQYLTLFETDLHSDTYETALLNLLRYHTSYLGHSSIDKAFPIDRAEISPDALDSLSPQQIQILITSNANNYDVIQQLQRQKVTEKEVVPVMKPKPPPTPVKEPEKLPEKTPEKTPEKVAEKLEEENSGETPSVGIDKDQLMEIQRHVKELIISQQANLPKGLTSEQQQQLVEKLLLRQIQQLQQQQLKLQQEEMVNASTPAMDSHTQNIPPLHYQETKSVTTPTESTPDTKVVASTAGEIITSPDIHKAGRKQKAAVKKPPITPYNLFIHEISGAVKQEFPNATFSELPKIYSKKWSNLSPEEKQEYTDKHHRMVEEYKASLLSFIELPPVETMDTNSSPKQITTPTATTTTTTTTTTTPPAVMPPVKPTCANDGCQNPAVPSEDRGISYCSNDCVVKHCRKVFDLWIKNRPETAAS